MLSYKTKLTFDANVTGRDFVVGDIHGHYDELLSRLSVPKFNYNRDRLFAVGDLCDRGPDSVKCLELLANPWFFSCLGNHEHMMIEAVLNKKDNHAAMWVSNGGKWFMDISSTKLEELCYLVLNNMPISIDIVNKKQSVGICHAQPPSDDWHDTKNPSEKDFKTMIWGRKRLANEDQTVVKNVTKTYHGHTVVSAPVTVGNSHFIDTGCFYSGRLTLVQI